MKVTVIIPSYNRYTLLKRAILSLQNQSHAVDEIIVVDDGSSDNTSQIVQDFPCIKYMYQENSGVSAARNLGITCASNEWLAFLDSDDEWYGNKLEEQVALHNKNPNCLISYTAENWIRNGTEVKIPKKYRKLGENIFQENLSYCNIAPSSILVHKSILDSVGSFDTHLRVCEDYDLWLRILCSYEIRLLNRQLIKKHAGHDEQLGFTKNMDTVRIQILQKILKTCKSQEKINLIKKELTAKLSRVK